MGLLTSDGPNEEPSDKPCPLCDSETKYVQVGTSGRHRTCTECNWEVAASPSTGESEIEELRRRVRSLEKEVYNR